MQTEMMVICRKKFILTDSQKQESQHTTQGHLGKHEGPSGGRRVRKKHGGNLYYDFHGDKSGLGRRSRVDRIRIGQFE